MSSSRHSRFVARLNCPEDPLADDMTKTLALELPLTDEEEKGRRRKKRKSDVDPFIEDDSSEEERQANKRKTRKIRGLLFNMNVSRALCLLFPRNSLIIVAVVIEVTKWHMSEFTHEPIQVPCSPR